MLGLNKFDGGCLLNAATEHIFRGSDEKPKIRLLVLPVPMSTFKPGISQIRDKNIPRFYDERIFFTTDGKPPRYNGTNFCRLLPLPVWTEVKYRL